MDLTYIFKVNTMSKKNKQQIGRDARNGQFIPVKEAQRRPSTTVIETVKRQPQPK